ncbi:MAG: hypothetical protein PHD43_12960 [Methylococcales bacterium]|nr:hypothetical protein [Methylococcales bacterium]
MATNTAPHFTFDEKGKVITDFSGYYDASKSMTLQADGKILVAGIGASAASFENNGGFALVRYNNDGSLDTGFSDDGKIITELGPYHDSGNSVIVQADGKILVVGSSQYSTSPLTSFGNFNFALVRYNSDGSLDTSFSDDGIVITRLGSNTSDSGASVAVQTDGKILVAGSSYNFAEQKSIFVLVRYNSDGSLDTGFSGDGKVTTEPDSDAGYDGNSVVVQADGKILVAGSSGGDFTLVRYNSDGSLDTSFSDDGIVITDMGSFSDNGKSVTVQADGKILVAGSSYNTDNIIGKNYFALVRYNSDGSLDAGFSGDGKVTTELDSGAGYDGSSVVVQADGKILVAGSSGDDFTLVRYNSDGSLDTSFSGDGKVTTSFGAYKDSGNSVAVQADGKIVVSGSSYNIRSAVNTSYYEIESDFAIVRYNADGSLDNTFGVPVNTLNGIASYIENDAAVELDRTVNIYDAELGIRDKFDNNYRNYNGASITLARHGGANSEDVFSLLNTLSVSDGNLYIMYAYRAPLAHIGTVSNSNGTLSITFNDNAGQQTVNQVLSSLGYSNTSDTPPASVQIDWTFNDGNTGAQGTGGALTALGSTLVNITPTNDAPVLTTPTAINYTGMVFDDIFATATGKLIASDVDSSSLTYGITGGTEKCDGAVSKSSMYGVLTVNQATGAYSFAPNDAAIEALTANASADFTVTASDGSLTSSNTLTINIAQNGITESTGNDMLASTSGNDKFNGLAGADAMKGCLGNDLYVIDNAGDKVFEISHLATEIDTVNSSISFTLGAHLENLTLIGTGAINGTGNVLKNVLIGYVAANVLNGSAGNDALTGEAGNDLLTDGNGNDPLTGRDGKDLLMGGGGDEIFRLTTLSKDIFVDFRVADDTVQLENSVFTQLTATGVLSSDNFKTGAIAADANDYVIYNRNTDALLYDADGSGAGAAMQIAVLGINLALTHTDFVVI